ncbi:hypothetical protein BZG36_01402 [Bifiguratus adelaidae]|uniref:Eukaryotic translation initiation factor 3 subunit H n=1 Tax=Bifiguratus adelaidae TaxID=1938954 RepID=A0A261Y3G4_9FUNG|nr:hypothetical protein BZG36_01402 [Bifiguratus adelaidae]
MSRPEHIAPPEIFYGDDEAKKYTQNSRIASIQAEMAYRALELLMLPEDQSCYLLDIGCGSGLSGEILEEEGHIWVGMDIAPSMLDIARDRDVEGDLFLQDVGQGMAYRPGTFDGAISISVLQWLCNADKQVNFPKQRLARFFSTLYSSLKRGARAIFQFYPENDDQIQLIIDTATRCGFEGGLLVDYPNSKKAKKYYLCLFAGQAAGQANHMPKALGEDVQEPQGLDALVVLKIIKHCREAYPTDVTGQLLGLDVRGVLEVTHCFPIPNEDNDDVSARYQLDMMRCLREVNVDNNTVGWYRSATLGTFMDLTLIDTQYNYQTSLSSKSVVIIHDVSKSAAQGNLELKALRLTDKFMKLYADKKFTTESLAKAQLSFSTIFEELPIRVHNSNLASALLQELDTPNVTLTQETSGPASSDSLNPNFDILELELDPFMEKNLENLLDCADAQQQETNNYMYWQRSVAREQAKLQSALQKRRAENQARQTKGEAPLPEDDIHSQSRLPPEPSRLESMLLNAQMHHYTKQLNQYAGPSLARLFAVQELQK